MCMGSVDGRDSLYVFTSKVHYYIMGAHLLCTHYVDSFFIIEVGDFKPTPNCQVDIFQQKYTLHLFVMYLSSHPNHIY